jgi:hypothetical protein
MGEADRGLSPLLFMMMDICLVIGLQRKQKYEYGNAKIHDGNFLVSSFEF